LVSREPAYPSIPFRPIVEDNKETCCDINNLMVRCWAEDPNDRPDFATIKTIVRKINK
jgi:atrial natriuretic peptide receptor A